MKIRIKKHQLTLEDFTQETFTNKTYDTIEARILHNTYNKFLQYYFIKLIYDAVEFSRTICDCQSRLIPPKTILEQCDDQCEQIPNEEKFIKFIEDNLVPYRNYVYNKFDEWIEWQRHQCDNECGVFTDIDFKDLKYPVMNCLHLDSVISNFLEFNDTEALQEHILQITEYLDLLLETDTPNVDIETLKWFEYIKQFNELKISQWPTLINLTGFRNNYDGAEGEFYLLEDKQLADYGIINNFKGLCYKRVYTGDVKAIWFGVQYFEDHTDIFRYLLRNDSVDLGNLTYNIEMTETQQRPINNSINWYGQNATLNITFTGANSVLEFILLNDIYEIKISGLSIRVNTEQDIPFINMNEDFKVDIFLFDSTLQSTLGVETNDYITLGQESIKSDIFWSVLPLIPTLKDIDNELALVNFGYINVLKQTTVDAVLTTDTVQNIEVKYNCTNSPKVLTESTYGSNRLPLLKKYLNDTYFHSIAEKYIEGQKAKIVAQMDVQLPDNFIMTETIDNGFIDPTIKSNEPWNIAGSGKVNQDFNRLLHLPNYIKNLEFIKENILKSNYSIFNTSPFRKNILTRLYKYNRQNPIELECVYRDDYSAYVKMTNSSNDGLETFENYQPRCKQFTIESDEYYLIYVRCNQTYEMRDGNAHRDTRWDNQQYSPERIIYDLLNSQRTSWNASMNMYKMDTVKHTGGSIAFNFNYIGKFKDSTIPEKYTEFKQLWKKPTENFNFVYTDLANSKYPWTKYYVAGRTQVFYVKASDVLDIVYYDDSVDATQRTVPYKIYTYICGTPYIFQMSTDKKVFGAQKLYLRFTNPWQIISKMKELTTPNKLGTAFNATMYNYATNSNITVGNMQLTYLRDEEFLESSQPYGPYSVFDNNITSGTLCLRKV